MSEAQKKQPGPKAGTRKRPPKAAPTAATQAPPVAAGWEVSRVLKVAKPLMKGDDVKALQAALIEKGYHCGINGANGIFGRDTAHAVRCFQAYNRLIVDGRAGRFTVAALGGAWKG